MRVLLVDDSRLLRMLAALLLEKRGHEVVPAEDVDQAIAALDGAAAAFDIVVLDLQLPGGGGEAVLRRIRAKPAGAAIKVVAFTTVADADHRERLIGEGFDGVVSKPVDPLTFGPRVESFVHGAR
jgi:CheY-like chemotaxis protein